MAKKVVATMQSSIKKDMVKLVIPMVSLKTGAYTFKSKMMTYDEAMSFVDSKQGV